MNANTKLTTISKFMSLVLRHQPRHIGLALDAAGEMAAQGHVFFCSANDVWLVEAVPSKFIEVQA